MMSGTGPSSPSLNPLDCQVSGQCWRLITSCNKGQKQFPEFKNALQLIRFALPEKAIDNAVKDYHK